ncbi:MAG TPA: C_GCAxxG_C_C family protein [Chloroflexi bacterium]|nr:C_GCAxxG_C_C family protein [Chloroflexota bacterium]
MIAVGDHLMGQTPEVLIRASNPFGGGVGGCRQELCGVLAGAMLVLGATRGRLAPTEDDKALYDLVCRYRERFIATFGSSQCEAVRNTMPEMDKRCAAVVEGGVRLLLEML